MLVYDQAKGFDNLLSNYYFLDEQKKIQGGGRGYFIEECPDIKFTKKTFKEVYKSNKEFRKVFDKLVISTLEKFHPTFSAFNTEKLSEYGEKVRKINPKKLKNKDKFKKCKNKETDEVYYKSLETGRRYFPDGLEYVKM
jgi:hypothetical protein